MKTAVITGATSGIGLAVAKTLAQQEYCVIGVGRSREKCDAAIEEVKRNARASVVFFCGDLAQQTDVNRIAVEIGEYLENEHEGKLSVLINNAGGVRNWYTTTNEGYETQFALNHLAGFLLTYRLMAYLEKANGKVMMTGSDSHMHTKLKFSNIMHKRGYNTLMVYKRTKLCNLFFAKEFNRRFENTGICAYVVDPGLVNTDIGSKGTSGIVSWVWKKRQKHGADPSVSAQTYAYLCSQPDAKGLYYHRCEKRRYSDYANDESVAKRLWDLSEKLCEIDYKEAIQ